MCCRRPFDLSVKWCAWCNILHINVEFGCDFPLLTRLMQYTQLSCHHQSYFTHSNAQWSTVADAALTPQQSQVKYEGLHDLLQYAEYDVDCTTCLIFNEVLSSKCCFSADSVGDLCLIIMWLRCCMLFILHLRLKFGLYKKKYWYQCQLASVSLMRSWWRDSFWWKAKKEICIYRCIAKFHTNDN